MTLLHCAFDERVPFRPLSLSPHAYLCVPLMRGREGNGFLARARTGSERAALSFAVAAAAVKWVVESSDRNHLPEVEQQTHLCKLYTILYSM